MKYGIGCIGVCMLMVLIQTAMADDISGDWIVVSNSTDIKLKIEVDGAKVTGKVDNPLHGEAEIKEGKIDGDSISFYVERSDGLTHSRASWKGVIEKDIIKFTVTTVRTGPVNMTAYKPKADAPAQTENSPEE